MMTDRKKKLYKVHIDIKAKTQYTMRVIPCSVSVIASNEQEAKNIARHTRFTCDVGKAKLEMDLSGHDRHNLIN